MELKRTSCGWWVVKQGDYALSCMNPVHKISRHQSGYAAVGSRSGKVSVDDIMVPRSKIIGIDIS